MLLKKQVRKIHSYQKNARQSDWNLKVVNVKHTISASFKPTLSTVDNSQQVDSRVVTSYNELRAGAAKLVLRWSEGLVIGHMSIKKV
ncbi:hypothetical protein [Paucilactobacillus hokkaidonensis]|uniref:hypothetical protein n=1 Tax=Paucilactobacillus hokkaidonensis TaxID=1193095 RepID=UPI00209287E7|nr:hypothetical protein [Paucilactobacillus hokkaidonensis]